MSRRARLEEEKLKQLNDELKEEEDKIKLQKERIYAPIFWKRLAWGIRIQDLKAQYYEPVLAIVEEHYIPEEVLCRNSCLKDDPVSVKSFLNKVAFNLRDQTSIIALDEQNEDAIAGFLVLRAVRKEDFGQVFSRVQLVDGDAHKKCVAFSSHLSRKSDIYGMFNCDVFLRFYLLCITPAYRKKALGFQLMLTGQEVARSLKVPIVAGMFSCYSLQKIARRIGMKVVHEIYYVDWKDRFSEMIFDEPGVGNYTCAIMAGELPPPPPPPPPPPKVEEEIVKLTREEKRKAKAKKQAKNK